MGAQWWQSRRKTTCTTQCDEYGSVPSKILKIQKFVNFFHPHSMLNVVSHNNGTGMRYVACDANKVIPLATPTTTNHSPCTIFGNSFNNSIHDDKEKRWRQWIGNYSLYLYPETCIDAPPQVVNKIQVCHGKEVKSEWPHVRWLLSASPYGWEVVLYLAKVVA